MDRKSLKIFPSLSLVLLSRMAFGVGLMGTWMTGNELGNDSVLITVQNPVLCVYWMVSVNGSVMWISITTRMYENPIFFGEVDGAFGMLQCVQKN